MTDSPSDSPPTAALAPEEWWGADVVPRIRWMIVVDAMRFRRKEISEGEIFPDGYGIAWRCFDRNAAVCMPIPLNVVVGWLRWFWIELRHGLGVPPTRLDRAQVERVGEVARARDDGYRQGFDRGYDRGIRHAHIAIQASLLPPDPTP